MQCPTRCVVALQLIANLIIFTLLMSATLLVCLIWLKFHFDFENVVAVDIVTMNVLLEVALGVLAVLALSFGISMLAARRRRFLVGFHIAFTILRILGEIAVIALAFIYPNELPNKIASIATELSAQLQTGDYATKDGNNFTYTALGASMNAIQQKLECCGIDGPRDYAAPTMEDRRLFDKLDQPFSCCSNMQGTARAPTGVNGTCNTFSAGCKSKLEAFSDRSLMLFVSIVFTLICFEIFGLIFGVCICRLASYDDWPLKCATTQARSE